MTEIKQEATTEDKFFGVKHAVKKPSEDDLEIEVVDTRSEDDQKYGAKEIDPEPTVASADDDDDDDELENYSEKVQKRIKKLTYDKHEFRRKAEEAERVREEAIRAAQVYQRQAMDQQQILQQGEKRLLENIRERSLMQLENAKTQYRHAYEEGNTDKIIEAQEAMMRSQADLRSVDYEMQRFAQPQRAPQRPPQPAPRQPQRPQVSPKAAKWAQENPWFSDPNHRDPEMAATALGIHEKLISSEGYHPESDEYYAELDKRIKKRYPEFFQSAKRSGGNVVVAPVERSNSSAQRKVTLTRDQVALAKRLRLTPQQYAEQLLKEAERNG